jgi:ribosomal protein S28E/S33
LAELGALSVAQDVRERVLSEARACPHCGVLVHPSRADEHHQLYHASAMAERLAALERQVEDGLRAFCEAGKAIAEINQERLYLATHATWDEYLKARWQFSRQHAHTLMQAAGVVERLLSSGLDADELPQFAAHAAPLATLPDEALANVWALIKETAPNGQVTRAHVQSVVTVARQAILTGAVDGPEGESVRVADVFQMAITEEHYERLARQQQHIAEGRAKREVKAGAEPIKRDVVLVQSASGGWIVRVDTHYQHEASAREALRKWSQK